MKKGCLWFSGLVLIPLIYLLILFFTDSLSLFVYALPFTLFYNGVWNYTSGKDDWGDFITFGIIAVVICLLLNLNDTEKAASPEKEGLPEPQKNVLKKIVSISVSFQEAGIGIEKIFKILYALEKDPLDKRKQVYMHKRKRFMIIPDVVCSSMGSVYINKIKSLNVCYNFFPHRRKVEKIVERMMKCMPGKLNGKYLLLNTNEINAMCLPDGTILVTRGLISMTNDDELALVIGHEYGHFFAEHHAERISKGMMVAFINGYMKTVFKEDDDDNYVSRMTKSSLKAAFMKGYTYIFKLPTSRTMEEEADRIGLYLVKKAGYDVKRAILLWDKFKSHFKEEENASDFYSTHPTQQSRKEAALKLITELEKLDEKTLPQWGSPMDEIKEYAKVAAIKSYLAMQKKQDKKEVEKTQKNKGFIQNTTEKVKDWWNKRRKKKDEEKSNAVEAVKLPEAA